MSVSVAPRAWDEKAAARSALRTSAIAWFVPAMIGQWFFAYHVAKAFIAPAVLELYLLAKHSRSSSAQFATAALLFAAAAATGIGVYGTAERWMR
jgi:hypothetical protein